MSFSTLTAERALPSNIPHSQKQIPSKFLVLSPTPSASFEQPLPLSKTSDMHSPSTTAAQAASAKAITALSALPAEEPVAVHKPHRSSSVSTTNSDVLEKKRFLRLGPVQSGGEPSDSAFVEED